MGCESFPPAQQRNLRERLDCLLLPQKVFVAAGWDEVLSPASRYARSPGKKVSVEKVMFSKGCKLRKFVAIALLILF